jgi:hypothetical protein
VNRWYPTGKDRLLGGTLNLLGDNLVVSLFSTTPYSDSDSTVSQLSGQIGVPAQPLAGRTVSGGVLGAADMTFPAVPENVWVYSLVLYRASDGALVAYLDQRPDLAPIGILGNGGPITFAWHNGQVLQL